MNRLLTDEEIELVYVDFNIDCDESKDEDSLDKYIAKAQDAKTASLIATQIFKELEEPCPHEKGTLKADCRFCYQAIKSKWGIE